MNLSEEQNHDSLESYFDFIYFAFRIPSKIGKSNEKQLLSHQSQNVFVFIYEEQNHLKLVKLILLVRSQKYSYTENITLQLKKTSSF